MTDLPAPIGARLQRPSWRDTRLLVGLLIVVVSVAAGARVIAAADDTVPVYAASTTLVTGRTLAASDLTVVRVRLGSVSGCYLGARSPLPEGTTLLRTLGPGELIPVSALGSAAQVRLRPVTVPLDAAPPPGLVIGSRVDVWSSARDPATGTGAYRPPVRLVTAAEVSAVSTADSGLSLSAGAAVQVLLADAQLRSVLDAMANAARIALVPVPGTARPSTR